MSERQNSDIVFCYKNGFFRRFSAVAPLQLYRLNEREVVGSQSVDPTVHPMGTRVLIGISGEGVVSGANVSIPFSKNTVIYIGDSDGEYTVTAQADNAVRYAVLELAFYETIEPTLHSAVYAHFAACRHTFWFSKNNATDVVSQMIAELCLPSPMTERIKGLLDQMLIHIYRAAVPKEEGLLMNEPSVNAVGHTVYAVIRYIEDNLYSIHSLMEMAEKLGYSYNYLSHLFRRKTGMTIQNYFAQKKIDASRELLLNERYSITEISTMLNYDCIQSFSKAFKKAMGMSPTEFRALYDKNG